MRSLDIMFWCAAGIMALFLVALPTGATAQYLLAVTALATLLVLKLVGPSPFLRQIFVVFTLALVLKYLYWRTTSTIPPFEAPLDAIAALAVLGAEMFCVVMLFTSVFVMIDPKPSRRTPPLPANLPTVDVLVPSYNEDSTIVASTLAAAKAMIYDPAKLNVHLLDDGATDEKLSSLNPEIAERAAARKAEMQEICCRLGVTYIARPDNEMAKAGNLNYALGHTNGELVAVFDADHAPSGNFLQETLGHFGEDDRLFLVQTPHVFLNPDPIERNLSIAGYVPSENEMFYGAVQRGLDSWNASFFCGSAAVLRRTALEEVNGFSGRSITEDCESALELHSRGWNSRYVDKPLIRGLQPETFASFIGQRSRWCRGMIQIFFLKSPWFIRGLTLKQRVCYSSSCMFWFFPFARWIFMIAPLLFIFFDMRIYAASAEEFLVYTVPYLAAAILLQGYLFGKYRWPWISELYEYIQSVFLLRAVTSVITAPTAPKFNVTDKGVTLEYSRLSSLALPYFVLFGLFAAAAAYTGYRLANEPDQQTLLLVVGGWNIFNLILAALALGTVCERRERRGSPRRSIGGRGFLDIDGNRLVVKLLDVSQGGVRFTVAGPGAPNLAVGADAEFLLRDMPGGGEGRVRVVIRNRASEGRHRRYGASFLQSDARRYGVIAALLYGGSVEDALVPEHDRGSRNVLIWTAELVVRAIHQTWRGAGYALLALLRGYASDKPTKP